MCAVGIEHENNNKRCKYFLVPGNGQVLLGMPDIDAPNRYRKKLEIVIIAVQTGPLPREKT